MGLRITNNGMIEHNISKAQKEAANSLEKLSSGVRFTRSEPHPAERAVSDSLSYKMREINSYKQNANEGISLVQMADSALSEMSNIVIRLKELATASSSATLSDKERSFLFVEYQSLYDEMERIARTTEFNGVSLLNGEENEGGRTMSFRIGPAAQSGQNDDGQDLNVVSISHLNEIIATPEALGLKNVVDLLENPDGITLDDVEDIFESSLSSVSDSFDKALENLAGFRSGFGSVSSRLGHVMDVLDVSYENVAAANSRLRDVDYASEIANLTKANMLVQAGTSLLTQGNIPAQAALTLIRTLDK